MKGDNVVIAIFPTEEPVDAEHPRREVPCHCTTCLELGYQSRQALALAHGMANDLALPVSYQCERCEQKKPPRKKEAARIVVHMPKLGGGSR